MISKRTSVNLTGETKDRLASLGRKGDTYEDIIKKLIDYWCENHQ